ncbi:hypothetical protein F383_26376 [Gossypium arboreum]|uniref:Uncharacterized protein n=1 Tax=Gossypium arboreum TaxID=29729 RepID=A0A0B0MLL2_GOSAR|nr:hypothetical protein F383_26376 [Gossypium arboreum]
MELDRGISKVIE